MALGMSPVAVVVSGQVNTTSCLVYELVLRTVSQWLDLDIVFLEVREVFLARQERCELVARSSPGHADYEDGTGGKDRSQRSL